MAIQFRTAPKTEKTTLSPGEKPPPTFRERYQALKNLPAFFRQIWETQPWLTSGNLILRIFRSAIPLLTLWIGKLIIDEVVLLVSRKSTDYEHIMWLIGAEFGLAILADLLNRALMLLDSLLGDLYANKTSVQIMEHAATLDLAQFEDATFYDKLERARQQTVGRTALLSQTLAQLQDFISMLFLAIGLAAFNPWLILLVIVAVIPSFLGELYFNSESYSLMYGWTPQRRELDYYRFIGASDDTAKEIKIFGLSPFLIDRYKNLSDKYYRENRKLSIRRAGWGSGLLALGTAGYYAAYVFIILQTISGSISLGSLTFLAGSFRQLRGSLEAVLGRFTSISQGALYLRDLFDFFAIQPGILSPVVSRPFPHPIRTGFVFENVGFRYHNSEKWANRNLSFTLRAGEKLALVGENGAGKTTLVKLLARLYDPDEGRILLDGYDLKEYNLDDLRRNTGVIFQDYLRFQFTAGTNIAIGKINEKENQPLIEHAAGQSLANLVIENLPQQYEQMLGRRFNGGSELSGGEWQKIALARAYMREAQLLILDEPTAALDARAEYEVFQRFSELTQGKTAVLISHRFSTVRMADRILVLDKGQMREMGSHEELMATGGKYAELFNLQAKGYQ
jgi:ATP-binding cassette, subfamily B, bacterial